MSKDIKYLKIHLLIFPLFIQLDVIRSYSCPNMENSYRSDYQEFTTLDDQIFPTEDSEFDPLGLNFESAPSQSETEFFHNFKDSLPDRRTFRGSNKSSDYRRETKNHVKVVLNSYQTDFDRRYPRGSNYSEIFQDLFNRSVVNRAKTRKATDYSYTSFPSLYEVEKKCLLPTIYEYLEVLEKFEQGRAMIFPLRHHNGSWNIVHTNFGNEILSIRIKSRNTHEGNVENPIIVVVAGIHGRDWYAIQSAIFLATELIINENRTNDGDFDWWIVPVINPDGYEISQTDTRWRNWEKNLHGARDAESSDECFGVDLDLNFEYQWLDCNNTPCDSNFPGKVPFIAPEARGLRDTLEAFSDYLDSFVALKEGRQMLVYPFSDTLESPRNVDNFEKISTRALEAFGKHVEGFYEHGQSSNLINISAGFIEDWAKVHLGVDKSFAFYLGPTTKDRRDLKSQHLMEHMNGTVDLLNVIAHGRIYDEVPNSSSTMYLSIIYLVNFLIVR